MRTRTKGCLWILVLLGMTAMLAGGPAARAADSSYNVMHNFWWAPGAGQIPVGVSVNWMHFEHAWASQPGFASQSSYRPLAQAAGFNAYGTDWMDQWGRVWNSDFGVPVRVNEAVVNIPFAVPPIGGNSTVNAVSGQSWATANSSWQINQWGAMLMGFNRAWGLAHANPASFARAYAYSESKLNVRALTFNMRTGRFGWQPAWRDTASGSAYAYDPINISITDYEGLELLSDTPLHIEGELERGASETSTLGWEYGRLFADGVIDGTFSVAVSSSYIPTYQQGSAFLRIENGLVVESACRGIFSGLLPPVGMPGTFDISFPYEVDIDFSYPDIGQYMAIEFGGGGSNEIIPEPATLSLVVLGGMSLIARRRK